MVRWGYLQEAELNHNSDDNSNEILWLKTFVRIEMHGVQRRHRFTQDARKFIPGIHSNKWLGRTTCMRAQSVITTHERERRAFRERRLVVPKFKLVWLGLVGPTI